MSTDRESPFEFSVDQAPESADYSIGKGKGRKKMMIHILKQQKTMVQIDGHCIVPRYTFVIDFPFSIRFCMLQQLMFSPKTRKSFADIIAKVLPLVGVAEQKYHSLVYEKLLIMIKSGVLPGLPIRVHVTENMPPIVIEGLETVDLDASTIEQTPSCVVCMEDFLCFDDQDEDDDQISVATRLPCGHHFHGDCIVKSLIETSHFCPLCRYPLAS